MRAIRKQICVTVFFFFSMTVFSQNLPIDTAQGWYLSWSDEFEYENAQLDEKWDSQNGPSGHILCSRWRENAVVSDGVLELQAKKENKGGQEWTAGSIRTKKRFQYGYFECRYKYAAANATNNSFWLMSKDGEPDVGKRFELDINEGHFPNEVNTNIHQWSDFWINEEGRKVHQTAHKGFSYGALPGYSIQLEIPVNTNKIRLSSNSSGRFSLGELRVYGFNNGNYPDVMSASADEDIDGLVNLAGMDDVRITSSGSFQNNKTEKNLIDGNPLSSWNTQEEGEKWVEFEWKQSNTIGCIQFLNGWKDTHGNWNSLLTEYKLQYWNGKGWIDISVLDVQDRYDFAEDYHTYGLLWTEKELVFYFDGEEIRRENNDFCYSPSPIWLSLAIIKWSGPVTDAIDGTSMKVDYVRYYEKCKQ